MSDRYWQSPDGRIRLILGDCLTIDLPEVPDAVITDPPYGINYNREGTRRQDKHHPSNRGQTQTVRNDDKPFDPSPWLRYKKVVLWGASAFADKLPINPAWLCWDKVTRNSLKLRIAEFELAWAKPLGRSQMFRFMWAGRFREEIESFEHPTQKPVPLMEWCMDVVKVGPDDLVLDPYMGSGSTGVACVYTGRRFIGVELDRQHFETAVKRVSKAVDENNFGFFKTQEVRARKSNSAIEGFF